MSGDPVVPEPNNEGTVEPVDETPPAQPNSPDSARTSMLSFPRHTNFPWIFNPQSLDTVRLPRVG
jgi:hypothetical protein